MFACEFGEIEREQRGRALLGGEKLWYFLALFILLFFVSSRSWTRVAGKELDTKERERGEEEFNRKRQKHRCPEGMKEGGLSPTHCEM